MKLTVNSIETTVTNNVDKVVDYLLETPEPDGQESRSRIMSVRGDYCLELGISNYNTWSEVDTKLYKVDNIGNTNNAVSEYEVGYQEIMDEEVYFAVEEEVELNLLSNIMPEGDILVPNDDGGYTTLKTDTLEDFIEAYYEQVHKELLGNDHTHFETVEDVRDAPFKVIYTGLVTGGEYRVLSNTLTEAKQLVAQNSINKLEEEEEQSNEDFIKTFNNIRATDKDILKGITDNINNMYNGG